MTTMTAAAPQNLRHPPNEEFFRMCLLSLKMQHRKRDYILSLDHKVLYKKAMADPEVENKFYRFYEWI